MKWSHRVRSLLRVSPSSLSVGITNGCLNIWVVSIDEIAQAIKYQFSKLCSTSRSNLSVQLQDELTAGKYLLFISELINHVKHLFALCPTNVFVFRSMTSDEGIISSAISIRLMFHRLNSVSSVARDVFMRLPHDVAPIVNSHLTFSLSLGRFYHQNSSNTHFMVFKVFPSLIEWKNGFISVLKRGQWKFVTQTNRFG